MKETKLKIAMLGHKHIPSREGGVEVVVQELSARMVRRGCCVTCYNRGGGPGQRLRIYRGVRLKTAFTVGGRGVAAMTSSAAAALSAALGDYDVVHFHAEGACAMLWLPKLFGKRCVATIHGLDHRRAKWGRFARAYLRFGERCAAKYADEIIVLSNSAQRYFERVYGRKTRLIPNGVSKPVFRQAELIRERWALEQEDYLLFLGRLVPEKGVHDLIRAFAGVQTEKKLVIAGAASDTGSYARSLQRMAADDARVVFTGFVEGRALEELYSNAYAYVLPSAVEGMPLGLLEAMSYGCCCVVSDIPECTEVVGDRAARFCQGDAEALRRTLQRLCEDRTLAGAYREAAAGWTQCGWDEVADETLALYRAVAIGRGRRRCES